MRNRAYAVAFVFILLATASFANNPPPGAGVLLDLYSPLFLAGGTSTVGDSSPAADVLNPAASGAKQRLTFDLNGTALLGTQAPDNGFGLALNGGLSLPTRVGVISGSVTWRSNWKLLAPSILAASYSDSGMPCKPAR